MIIKCLQIFAARIVDVTLGTIRTVYFVKGKVLEPFFIAFLELLVWFFAAREALSTTYNIYLVAIFYALGYATGTLLGTLLSKWLIKGIEEVEIIVDKNNKLIKELKKTGYTYSLIKLEDDKVMIYIQIKSNRLNELKNIINKYDDKAFIAVSETKLIQNGILK